VSDVDTLRATAEALGGELVVASVRADGPAPVHHPQRLAAAYRQIMCTGPTRSS
jgi:hypothetical protein